MTAPARERPTARPIGARILLAAAVAASIALPLALTQAPQDDAYISYVYARNFARGEGLVFNAGEEPVEGYTNFLWTLLIGTGMRAGLDPERLAPAVGVACTAGVTLLTAFLARSLGAGPWFAALAALLFATRPALTVHAASGLETTFFALLMLLGIFLRTAARGRPRDDVAGGVALAAAALTRPEGILVFGLLELVDAGRVLARKAPARAYLSGAWRRALPFGAIVAAHLVWRFLTYGEWVPNTYYAKVSPGPSSWAVGARYCLEAIEDFGPIAFLLPFALAARAPRRAAWIACLVVSAVYVAYVASVGGDYLPGSRYLVPVLPLWCALAAAAFALVAKRIGTWWSPGFAAALLVGLATAATARDLRRETGWVAQDARHARLVAAGRKLGEILAPDAWIAVTNAGRLPYFADRRAIDMTGLCDRHIARTRPRGARTPQQVGHVKGDGDYVLDRKPEAIVLLRLVVLDGPLATTENWKDTVFWQAFAWSESQISRDPRFFSEYRLVSVPLPEVGAYLNVHVRPGAVAHPPEGMLEAKP